MKLATQQLDTLAKVSRDAGLVGAAETFAGLAAWCKHDAVVSANGSCDGAPTEEGDPGQAPNTRDADGNAGRSRDDGNTFVAVA